MVTQYSEKALTDPYLNRFIKMVRVLVGRENHSTENKKSGGRID